MDQNLINLAKQFVTQYYTTMQADKLKLVQFYGQNSTMTYGGDYFQGLKAITEKIESFGFQSIQFSIDDLDAQAGPVPNSFIIFVVGRLAMDGEDNFKFAQCFNIMPNQSGGYYVHNDVFRLVI